MLPNTMSRYYREGNAGGPQQASDNSEKRGLFARVAAALRWVAETPRRSAVIDELSTLSDHELADIGLNRSDLGRVFDPEFIEARETERRVIHSQFGRSPSF